VGTSIPFLIKKQGYVSGKRTMYVRTCLSVPLLELLKQSSDFHKIWYEY
jgi:hypothetical protein